MPSALPLQATAYSLLPTKIWLKPNLPLNSSVTARVLFDGNDLAPSLEVGGPAQTPIRIPPNVLTILFS